MKAKDTPAAHVTLRVTACETMAGGAEVESLVETMQTRLLGGRMNATIQIESAFRKGHGGRDRWGWYDIDVVYVGGVLGVDGESSVPITAGEVENLNDAAALVERFVEEYERFRLMRTVSELTPEIDE